MSSSWVAPRNFAEPGPSEQQSQARRAQASHLGAGGTSALRGGSREPRAHRPPPEANRRFDAAPVVQLNYFVHGRGQGHASRALSVLPALRREGWSVRLWAADAAMQALAAEGATPLEGLIPGPWAAVQLLRQARQLARRLRREGARLVVSDGHQPALLAARWLGLPSLAIGHDLVFWGAQLPAGLPRVSLAHQRLNAWPAWHHASRAVGVHFLPTQSRSARLSMARPSLQEPPPPASHEGPLLCYFRDANGASVRAALERLGQAVSLPGEGRHEPRAQFRARVARCRGVVASAGSNLLAECVLLGKPVFALYRRGDHEQRLNACMIERAQVGAATAFESGFERAGPGERRLKRFLERAAAGNYRRVDLAEALPPVEQVVLGALHPWRA